MQYFQVEKCWIYQVQSVTIFTVPSMGKQMNYISRVYRVFLW